MWEFLSVTFDFSRKIKILHFNTARNNFNIYSRESVLDDKYRVRHIYGNAHFDLVLE